MIGAPINQTLKRIAVAVALAFAIALTVSLANGLAAPLALRNSLLFTLLVTAIVAVLDWAMAAAQRKDYSPWLGFWLVIVLQLLGIVMLLILPARSAKMS